MKKKTENVEKVPELEKWIKKVYPTIVKNLQLGAMNVHIKNRIDDDESKNMGIVFSMKFSPRYKTLAIRYHKEAANMFKEGLMEQLFNSLTHEFVHVIVDPLSIVADTRFVSQEQYMDAVESVTEHVSMLVRENIKKDNPQLLIK